MYVGVLYCAHHAHSNALRCSDAPSLFGSSAVAPLHNFTQQWCGLDLIFPGSLNSSMCLYVIFSSDVVVYFLATVTRSTACKIYVALSQAVG